MLSIVLMVVMFVVVVMTVMLGWCVVRKVMGGRAWMHLDPRELVR